MNRLPIEALSRRHVTWRASMRIVPADLPALPLEQLDAHPRFVEAAELLLAAADGAMTASSVPRYASAEESALLAPFRFPAASRFSHGDIGIYYAARELETAIRETVHHDVRRLRDRDESVAIDKQVFTAPISGSIRSLVGREAAFPGVDSLDDYTVSRALGQDLVEHRVAGLIYASVRRPEGRCMAVFQPRLVGSIVQGARLRYHYDAERRDVVKVEEVRRLFGG